MALQKSVTNPTRATPYSAYIRVIDFRLNMVERTGRIVLGCWASKADHTAELQPLDTITVPLTRDGEPAVPAVLDGNGDEITPARAAVPSFSDIRAAYPALFTAIATAIEGFVTTHPDFAGTTAIPD